MQNSPSPSLKFFPVAIFTMIMGLGGLTLVYKNLATIFDISNLFYQGLGILTLTIFIVISLSYLAKIIKFNQAFKAEFNNPMALVFFPAIAISMFLISAILADIIPSIAAWIWYFGAGLQLFLTLYILNSWWHTSNWEMQHLTPVWFLPMAANIIAPAGAIRFATPEIAWFFFTVGIFLWLMLTALLFYRHIFLPPLPPVMRPTMFIFIAPPALGFIAYLEMTGYQVTPFALVLYFIAFFTGLMLFSQVKHFIKIPFALSWWAFIFPLTALTNASLLMYGATQSIIFSYIGLFVAAIVTALTLLNLIKTGLLIKKRKLCLPMMPPKLTNTANSDKTENDNHAK